MDQNQQRILALRQDGLTFREIGDALGITMERSRRLVLKAARPLHWSDRLPARARNFLHVRYLDNLPELEAAQTIADMTHRDLLAVPNMGRGACSAVIAWLARHGLKLRPEITLKVAPIKETAAPGEEGGLLLFARTPPDPLTTKEQGSAKPYR